MTLAYWFTQKEHGFFPVEKAALGGCDLSVMFFGGEWQWLVRHEGRDVAEGAARAGLAAKQQAEAVARRFLARSMHEKSTWCSVGWIVRGLAVIGDRGHGDRCRRGGVCRCALG